MNDINPAMVGMAQKTYSCQVSSKSASATNTKQETKSDKIEISSLSVKLQLNSRIVTATLNAAEKAVESGDAFFEAAGRTEYLTSIQSDPDTSSEATAGRILGGITGYIYKAWQIQHPDATAEDFAEFRGQIEEGVARGVNEALDILRGLQALDENLENEIAKTVDLLHAGITDFFDQESEKYL